MLRKIKHMGPYWQAPLLIIAVCTNNASRAATKDDLSPDDRQRFEELREELREANQLVDTAKRRAFKDDPLLLRAKNGIDRSRELAREAGKEDTQVNQFLSAKRPQERRTYERWLNCAGEVQDCEAFKSHGAR